MDFTSTVQQITREIPAWVLPPYPLGASIHAVGSQNLMVARISGLTCGKLEAAPETTTSTAITAERWAPNVSRATVI